MLVTATICFNSRANIKELEKKMGEKMWVGRGTKDLNETLPTEIEFVSSYRLRKSQVMK